MTAHDNTYSRFVAWLKVLLPVLALILLSIMFLISHSIDPSRALAFAKIDLDALAENQRITAPKFSGVTEDGAALSFSAASAQPDPDNPMSYTVTGLSAEIATPDGGEVRITAGRAEVDRDDNMLEMDGGVVLETSTDYRIQAEGLRAALDRTWAQSIGEVRAWGPSGDIYAGQIVLERQGEEEGTYLLVFKEGVKMVYTPQIAENE